MVFSVVNPILQVIGVHPGRGGEGASNDGLQGLDHFLFGFVFFKVSIIGIQCLIWVGLVWGVDLSLTWQQMRKRKIILTV